MKVPEEAVKAAARAFYGTAIDDVTDEDMKYALDQMRETLEVAAPHITKAAADYLEDRMVDWDEDDAAERNHANGYADAIARLLLMPLHTAIPSTPTTGTTKGTP